HTSSTNRDNTARYFGGGLRNVGTLTLTHSTVSGNTAFYYGGGVENYGPLTLIHSTVSGNTATQNGGGLYNGYDSPLTLIHSTVSGNTARYGGGLYKLRSRLTITSSIVASNPDGGDCYFSLGSINSHGYNVDSDGNCQLTAPTDHPGVDPLLGPLQDNGGPTLTH